MAAGKRFIVLSNWKMNKTHAEGTAFIRAVRDARPGPPDRMEVILCVPFTLLKAVSDEARDSGLISVGAQDVYWEAQGAYTGEISAPMLADAGARYGMVGHSERRALFAETDEIAAKKAGALLKAGIIPIVCLGESLEERKRGLTFNRLEYQFMTCFEALSREDMARTVILYEPLWAIGTGRHATPREAGEAHGFIRQMVVRLHSERTAARTRIVYGGSVDAGHAAALCASKDTDGLGVGSASWDVRNFVRILETCARAIPAGS